MTWDADTPNDSTYLAENIHTQIQNDKQMIRERFEASDGTITAHFDADSDDSGKHRPSKVGFCRIHEDYDALESFTPRVPGSIHAVQSPRSLYTIDDLGSPTKIYPVDHDKLDGLDDDDHPQYQTLDLHREFTGDLTVNGSISADTEGSSGSDSLPTSHADENWTESHGTGTLGNRHINGAAIPTVYTVSKAIRTGYFTITHEGQYTFPWLEGDNSTEDKVYYLILKNDNTFGFADADGNYADDAVVGVGEW